MAIDINETSNEIMMMAQMKVPCIMIDNDNFVRWWPSITKCMQQSDFIAIDLVCFVCLFINEFLF